MAIRSGVGSPLWDGAVDPFDGLALALGNGEQLILLGVGYSLDRLGLARGLEYLALLDALRSTLPALAPSASVTWASPVALGLHLAVHGVGDVGRRLDPLELDPDDAHPPFVGGVVEDLAELRVDHLTRGRRRGRDRGR